MANQKYIVTGAGGFVGFAITRALRHMGHEVTALCRGDYPQLRALGVRLIRCDLGAGDESWQKEFRGVHAVFHVAAKVDMWGRYRDFYHANVRGTENVLSACRAGGVKYLVFTSSPSVIADGSDLLGVNESYPYPARPMAHYPATKAIAERTVLSANKDGELLTVALRPHLIFGPGDSHFVPTIIERARAGRLVRVGDGRNLTDLTFIDDCVDAHLAALRALERGVGGGQAFFVSQGEPVNMWGWLSEVVAAHGLPPISRSISASTAMRLAGVFEFGSKLSGGRIKPLFTRFLVSQMSTSHYFSLEKLRSVIGFSPKVTMEEAMRRTFGSVRSQSSRAA